jgi:hypothetical protein
MQPCNITSCYTSQWHAMQQFNIQFPHLLINLHKHYGLKTVLTAAASSTYDPIAIICYLINLNLWQYKINMIKNILFAASPYCCTHMYCPNPRISVIPKHIHNVWPPQTGPF